MDAVKFIEERNRMCKSFGNRCIGCPAHDVCADGYCCAVDLESTLDATAQIAIVEKWSAAHPRKTRQSVFLEQFPNAKIVEGALAICPYNLGLIDKCESEVERLCSDCRREFWMQEVK